MRILSLLIISSFLIIINRQPDSPHGADFKISCKTCHSSKGWDLDKDIYSFNHNSTKLPLVGEHTAINCRLCHTSLVFSEAENECNSCHNDMHQASVGADCSRCHTPVSWLVNNINEIHQVSRFPLVGAHRIADCNECHHSESLVSFEVTGVNCIDCHREDYLATTNPNHIQSGISEDCSSCHQINAFEWTKAGFNHAVFPLAQGHSTVKCIDCHETTNYNDISPECYSCHQQNFLETTNPDHDKSEFSTICQDCHTLSPDWRPVNFNHSSFPLTLGHSAADCIDCHIGGNYTSTPIDCYSCHQQDYITSANPDHSESNISTICQDCHSINPGWKPVSLDHSSFPLTLGHSAVVCIDCHVGGNYTSTPIDCYSCHQQDYMESANPDHTGSNLSTICLDCHTVNPGWKPANFDHNSFPLTLGHSTPVCIDCHTGGNYSSTPIDCYACHQENYLTSTNPSHNAAGFPQNCETCHTLNPGWNPANFNHITSFSLTLGHSTATCTDCHAGENYTSTPIDCYSCHQQNYLAATNPNHNAGGFPQNCETCHTLTPGWIPTSFDHTSFPLTQGHSAPACTDCHTGGNYTSTSVDCYSCHQQDYNNTVIPDHNILVFSVICTQCHTTNPGWQPASYTQHDNQFFPINSGRHRGEWNSCTDCHTNTANYSLFTCFSCHEHNQPEMDSKHQGRTGYSYDSAECLRCHPRGTT